MSNGKITLVEFDTVERDYGFKGCDAIVDHPAHGRLLLRDAYAEDGLSGGAVRWRHGSATKLLPTDTIDSLKALPAINDYGVTGWHMVRYGRDESRPILDWTGHMVAAVAASAGLRGL